jgi:hypothetical protein
MLIRTFRGSLLVTVVAAALAYLYGGINALAIVLILGVLETSLSFDNAVVNSTVLRTMNPFWQRVFLTVGLLIAVVGMRLLFPLLIVGVTAHLSPVHAIQLALDKGDPDSPGSYGYLLRAAHPAIAAFGGVFLLMLFLDFVFEDRDVMWLTWIERPLARIGRLDQLSAVVAVAALLVAARAFAGERAETVLLAGSLGLVTYILVNGLGELFDESEESDGPADGPALGAAVLRTGKAALATFLYLEVLDASFSFDGVTGAFAITSDPIVIALGLGVGAMFVRSLTVYLVRQGTLDTYVYLEHGAQWAIGALAVLLLVTIRYDVPEVVTGLVGVGFIGAALAASIVRNRRSASESAEVGEPLSAAASA